MDREQVILATIRPMAEYTFPYITTLLGVIDRETGESVGSGLRCTLRERRAVITARHVIESALAYRGGFALSAGYARPPYLVSGKVHLDSAADLAIYYLPDDFPSDIPEVAFWPEARIQRTMERLSTDYLIVHGFPQIQSRFLRMVQGVATKSLPYGAMRQLEKLPTDLRPFEFALYFDPANMRTQEGSETFIDPHGLSGSAVWRIGISGRSPKDWTPEFSLVVGFLTQWRPDEQILVATSAAQLSEIRAG